MDHRFAEAAKAILASETLCLASRAADTIPLDASDMEQIRDAFSVLVAEVSRRVDAGGISLRQPRRSRLDHRHAWHLPACGPWWRARHGKGGGAMSLHHELITRDMRTTSRIVSEKFGKLHKSAAQKVYAQSPFADYLRAENGPEPQSSARALTPDQEASLGGFDMTLTEETILRHVEQSTLSGRRKTTQELAHLVNIGPQEAAECVSRLSAFDLIQRNTWHKKQWQITGHGSQLLWSLDRNRR